MSLKKPTGKRQIHKDTGKLEVFSGAFRLYMIDNMLNKPKPQTTNTR
jgi:hypothetical protein